MQPTQKPARGTARRIAPRWIVAAFAVLIAAGGYFAWTRYPTVFGGQSRDAKPIAAAPAVPVTIATIETADFPIVLDGLGTVQPLNTVQVRTRIDGQLMEVAYTEGQVVQTGDVLVRIDPRPYQAALDGAKAKKVQDDATLANARVDLARYTKLGEFSARQQLDTQAATVAQLTAQVAADQATIDNAQTQLGYATVQAPITGLTGFRQVDVGNIVTAAAATPLVTINQIEPISVVFTAPEGRLGDITAALARGRVPVSAYTTDGGRKLSDGALTLVNNQVDVASGTIRLKASFDNADRTLWPGLSTSTRMQIGTLRNALAVPDNAVQHGPDGLYLYLVDEAGKAHLQKVTVAVSNEGRSAVVGDLKAGQRAIAAGHYRVQPGTLVADAKPAERQASETPVAGQSR